MTPYNMPPGSHPSQDDARFFGEKEWEVATDEAAKLLQTDLVAFEAHVMAEVDLDLPTTNAMNILFAMLNGIEQSLTSHAAGIVLLNAYNEAVDRLARKQLEGGPR